VRDGSRILAKSGMLGQGTRGLEARGQRLVKGSKARTEAAGLIGFNGNTIYERLRANTD